MMSGASSGWSTGTSIRRPSRLLHRMPMVSSNPWYVMSPLHGWTWASSSNHAAASRMNGGWSSVSLNPP